MKKSILFLIVIISSLFMVHAQGADKQSAEKALTDARDMLQKSIAMNGGWKSTNELITSTELSITKGNFDQAVDLATLALREARLSYEQAQRESNQWSEPDYLHK